jgi:hypothetical protein
MVCESLFLFVTQFIKVLLPPIKLLNIGSIILFFQLPFQISAQKKVIEIGTFNIEQMPEYIGGQEAACHK